MPAFLYIGHNGEHIVGMGTSDLTVDDYEALPWELQQAVYLNRGSDGAALYQELPELVTESAPEPAASVEIPDASVPELNLPLDEPAEGDN